MPEPDLIELFVGPLERLQLRYLISGSVAAMLYGEPRVTHDIDLVIFLRMQDIGRLAEVFAQPQFYLPPEETISAEVLRGKGGQFNVLHIESALKADFFTTSRDELQTWAFRNVVQYQFQNTTVRLAPPEYVIVSKLEYYREGGSDKHLRDISSMLRVSGERIDRSVLNDWISRRGVEAEWRKVSP
jgi:hypothetical protein